MLWMVVDVSSETIQDKKHLRKQCNTIFKGNKTVCHHWILYPTKRFFKKEGKVGTFSDERRQTEFAASKFILFNTLYAKEKISD